MLFSEPNPRGRYPRSFVDLPTNAGLIASLSTPDDLGKFMAGRLPRSALPSVLHEATHHWCFSAPLGIALAMLFQRAGARMQEAALAGPGVHPQNEERYRQAMADARRYETAVHLLEPLAEGLALFCEFDVRSSSREVWPEPLAHVAHLFLDLGAKAPATIEALMARLEEVLAEMRADPELAQRKTTVLLGDITPSANPYLAGYMSVRWAWSSAAHAHPALIDAQVFFTYLRHYVFCDLELVRLLLSADEEAFNRGFATRIRDRLLRLHSGSAPPSSDDDHSFPARLDEFGWTMDAMPAAALIGLDAGSVDAGLGALRTAVQDFRQRAAADGDAGRIWAMTSGWIAQRDAFVLDCADVFVKVRADGLVRVHRNAAGTGTPFIFGRALDAGMPAGEGTGHAVMLLARRSAQRYFAVCLGAHVVVEASAAGADDEERAWLRELAVGVVVKRQAGERWHASMIEVSAWARQRLPANASIDADSPNSNPRTPIHGQFGLADQLARAADQLYARFVLPPTLAADRREAALGQLRRAGIAAFFPQGTARTFMPVVVGWSLGGCTEQQLDEFFGDCPTREKLDATIAAVNARARACWGADLIVMQDGRVLCTAI